MLRFVLRFSTAWGGRAYERPRGIEGARHLPELTRG
jgi:hypothetical protein